jgi:Cd2+/Zn2+-exporting ATPase
MTNKQKRMLYRIILTTVLLIALAFLPTKGSQKTTIEEIIDATVTPAFLYISGWQMGLLYAVPYLLIGYDILRKAALGIWHREVFDENFLMSVATIGAMALGEYAEGAAVMLFYQIGELFQNVAVGKSRKSISDLMDIRPDYANVEQEDQSLLRVDPDEVAIGTIIVAKPGEKIPIDGVVAEGSGSLDASALTGESLPREVAPGSPVISGCINLTHVLKIRTTKEFGESTVSKILELVEDSGMKKSRSENFITKFARIYTPAVCIGALLLALLPPMLAILMGNNPMWAEWINRALTFLVISCPCALVMSIPLSFFGGIGGAASQGILVKGSNYLEALSKTKTIVFDKTGTLTKGVFQVTEIQLSVPGRELFKTINLTANTNKDDADTTSTISQTSASKLECTMDEAQMRQIFLRLAAGAESFSSHPISKSIVRAWHETIESSTAASKEAGGVIQSTVPEKIRSLHDHIQDGAEHSGRGVSARVEGHRIAAGNLLMMEKEGISAETVKHAMHLTTGILESTETTTESIDSTTIETPPGTVVYVAIDGIYAGYIHLADVPKETAAAAIQELKHTGIKQTIMLTGDNRQIADQIGKQLSLDEVKSELLPADKVAQVEKLLAEKTDKSSVLAFVGDGINDAPVLTRADIGIAMGALGSDAAIEAADIVLMDDNPLKIPLAIRISRKCLRIVYQNIVFALSVKGICLILGAIGLANMWVAIFADVGVMVLAVLNAVRCLKVRSIPTVHGYIH